MADRDGMGPASVPVFPSHRIRKQRNFGKCAFSYAPFALSILLLGTSAPAAANNWIIDPGLLIRGTYSDNIALAPQGAERSDFVVEIAPRIHVSGNGARLKLNVDYQATEVIYTGHSASNQLQHNLLGSANVEAVEKFFFVDARANVSQQNISAFAPQVSNINVSSNRTETRAFSLSPYIRSTFGSIASYELRYTAATANAANNAFSRNNTSQWNATVRSLSGASKFGWGFDYSKNRYDYSSDFPANETEAARGLLTYAYDAQLKFTGSAGREKNNYNFGDPSATTYGVGVDWIPTERTKFSATRDHRFFGNGFSYSFSHRRPLSAIDIRYAKDVFSTTSQLLAQEDSPVFRAAYNSIPATTPEPQRRELAAFLTQQAGFSPTVGRIVFANTPFLDRRLEGALALNGARNTVLLSVYRSNRQSITNIGLPDIASNSSEIVQTGYTASWNHRVSGLTSLDITGSRTRSVAVSPPTATSTYRVINVSLSRPLGPKTSGSVSYRNSRFDSDTAVSDTRENAVIGTVSIRF